MFETDEKLSAACATVADAAHDALRWVEGAENRTVRDNGQLIKDLRKKIVEAGKLRKAAGRKMCAGVFGASQAGKSYLISALARKDGQRLMALFGTTEVDFIAEINPEGGKESTGLVTRFTTDRPASLPPGHPVRVGLLSETDVVKILANSFTFDVIHGDDDDEARHTAAAFAMLDRLRDVAAPRGHMTVEEVYDLEDYCCGRLLKTARMRALKKCGFWNDAAALAPRLSPEHRVALFSVLWEEEAVYTDIYRRLLNALTVLGHPQDAFCEPAALVEISDGDWRRSGQSIINVSTLNGIGEDSTDTVSILAAGGQPLQLPRAEVTALIAEMIIVMKDRPYPFFDHTDLLDFPGARTRKPHPRGTLTQTTTRTENILRGKVAYLFDRYCDEQELTSMLLCVGPSNQDVPELAGMIETWIEATHGTTPADRAQAETALFFILTKFDTAFEQGAGKGTDGGRWETRLQASLLDPFGGHAHRTRWVKEWTPGQPFNNLYWVRNPNFRQDALFDYENGSSMTETGVRADKLSFVETLRQAYLNNPTVQTYVGDPATAWSAGMSLNDGGVGRVADSLGRVCRPDTKRRQTAGRLERLSTRLHGDLSPYHISGDVETLRREKKTLAESVTRMLARTFHHQKLGEFLYAIRQDEKDAFTLFAASERAAAATSVGAAATSETAGPVTYAKASDDLLAELGLEPEAPPAAAPEAAPNAPSPSRAAQDLAEKFVADLEQAWSARVADIARDEALAAYLHLDPELTQRLADELRVTARRTGVFHRMVEAVRAGQQQKTGRREAWVWRQVSPACALFNDHLAFLGLGGIQRPEGSTVTDITGAQRQVFPPIPTAGDLPALKEAVEPYEKTYFLGWLWGLQHHILGNAEYQAGFSGNVAENAALGAILDRLRAGVPA